MHHELLFFTPMNRYKKLISDTVVLGVGTFGSKLLVFLMMPIYTALLSTSEYSTAELISATANLLIPLACVGISNGIFRFAAEHGSDKGEVFSSSVALLGFGLGGFLLLSPLLCLNGYFRPYVLLIAAYVFFADIQAVCAQYVRAIDRTRLFAIQGILNTLVTVLLNLLFLAVWDMGVTGYVLSVIIGNLLTAVFLIFAAKLWQVFRFGRIRRKTMSELLRFSLPLVPTTVCWLITDLSDRYLVAYFCGDDVNGIYSAAYKIPTVINLISGIFLQAWQFSAVAQSSDEKECSRFYTEVFAGFLSLIMIGTSLLILLTKPMTALLLNASYHGAQEFMPTLLCAAALEAVVSFLATVYLVRKKTVHSFVTAMAGAALNILLNLLLIPQFGALGAAGATLACYALVFLLRVIDVPRMIPFCLCKVRMTVSILALIASAAALTVGTGWGFWVCVALTVLVTALNIPALYRSFRIFLRRKKVRR